MFLYKVEVTGLDDKKKTFFENSLREAKKYKKSFFLEDVRIFKLTYELIDKEEVK